MRFITIASALIGAVAANNLEARHITASASASASASACPPASTVTVTAWGPPPGGKGSNSTLPTPTPTKALYVNGADSITIGAWTMFAGIAAAMLI